MVTVKKGPGLISTLFFDLDDTLVAYDAVSADSWRQACTAHLREDEGVGVDQACRTIRKHSTIYWSDDERARAGRQDSVSARRVFVAAAFGELGLPAERAIAVADHFSRVRVENMYLLPHAIETLTRFRDQALTMALLTNGDSPGQRAKVERFGLGRFFDLILVEGELGFGKPDRRVYLWALQELGASPEQTLMIGDNLIWDIHGAQAAGVRGVWFNWRKVPLPEPAPARPFAQVTDLAQLPAIVDADQAAGTGPRRGQQLNRAE